MFQLPSHPLRVLFIEDGPIFLRILRSILEKIHIRLDTTTCLEDGIAKAKQVAYDAVLLDLGLPDSEGIDTFFRFHEQVSSIPVIIFSATEDQSLAALAVQNGAQDFIYKGTFLSDQMAGKDILSRSIAFAIERHRVQQELLNFQTTLEKRVVARTEELNRANKDMAYELEVRRQYEIISNTSKDILCLVDRDYSLQAVNNRFCEVIGLPREKVVGKSISDLSGDSVFEQHIKPYLDTCLSGKEVGYSTWLDFGKAGEWFLDIQCYPGFDQDRQVTQIVINMRDETAQERARKDIKWLNDLLATMHQLDFDLVKATTPSAILKVTARYFANYMGFDRADLLLFKANRDEPILLSLGKAGRVNTRPASIVFRSFPESLNFSHSSSMTLPDLRELEPSQGLLHFLSNQGIRSCVLTSLPTEEGLLGVLVLSSHAVDQFSSDHIRIIGLARGHIALSLRKALMNIEIQEANYQLQQLASRLITAQEEERRNISLELHDEAGQILTALKLKLSMGQDCIPPEYPMVKDQFVEAIELTTSTMEKIRSIAHILHPPVLNIMGLDGALRDLCAQATRQSGIPIQLIDSVSSEIPRHLQVIVYRIVQEGITNILKHSRAAHAHIKLHLRSSLLVLEILDDGIGFQMNSSDPLRMVGMGLLGMQERIQAVGGGFHIATRPGEGTVITAQIPFLEEK